jgi:hypothetical protein
MRPPPWSSDHSSWLQIQRCGFESRRYQIFWELVGLERSQLSLVSTTEELFERKSSCSGLESREYGRGDPLRWQRDTLYPQKLALTSSTSSGRSVGIVGSHTQVTEFSLLVRSVHVQYVGFEGLIAVVMKSSSLWNIMPCSALKVKGHFDWTYDLRVQVGKRRASYQREKCWETTECSNNRGPLEWYIYIYIYIYSYSVGAINMKCDFTQKMLESQRISASRQ